MLNIKVPKIKFGKIKLDSVDDIAKLKDID